MRNLTIRALATFAAIAAFALPASAETMTFKATLSGGEEVPPTDSKATGNVEATLDTGSKKLSWKGSYSGLSGPATGAHFHGPAEPGKAAGVVVPVEAQKSPFEGSVTLTDGQVGQLTGGQWYFNIHTAQHQPGEIRGQVTKAK